LSPREGLKPPALRTIRAFAEALIPAGGALPGATEQAVDVPAAANRLVAAMPPLNRFAVNAGLRLFERSTFPRRGFSKLGVEARRRHIRKFEASRLGPRRDLLLLAKSLTCFSYGRAPAVERALGVTSRCEIGPGEDDPRWDPIAPPLDPDALVAEEGVERCDVVVVGSGAGGATAARVMAEAGLSVIVLEQGPYRDARTYSRDPIDAIETLYRDGGLTMCEGRPMIPMPVGRCVGGTTVVNSGTCFRTPGDLLTGWRDQHGIGWATELDGEFERVESSLHVRPVELERSGRNAQLCAEGADALGVSHGPIPRNAGRVVCCSSCPAGCALDAKQAMHVSELPRAVRAGALVRERVVVREVIVENGRAVGIRAEAGERAVPYEARARAVLLAGGALGTPELLLRQGLANSSGKVGRHLRIHPVCWVGGLFDEAVDGWNGVMQSWYVDEWHNRGITLEATFTPLPYAAHWLRGAGEEFKSKVEDFGRLGMVGVQYEDTSEGRVTLRGKRGIRIGYRVSRADGENIRFGIARAAQVMFAAGATEAYPQVGRLGPITPGQEVTLVEQARVAPAALRLEAFHPMGTTRMGADPRTSVVGPDGQTHDVPGLYVADSGLFPTATRVNPMVTIMAFARRIAAGLAGELA
jgi:choline dehydrogenase-like flavoprotein